MASTKKTVHLSMDIEVYEEAKIKYSNFSKRVNELVKADLALSDEEDVLIKELEDAKAVYHAAKSKLCDYRKKQAQLSDDNSIVDEILDWALMIHDRRGQLGLNMLERECKNKHVKDVNNVRKLLEERGVKFVNFDGA